MQTRRHLTILAALFLAVPGTASAQEQAPRPAGPGSQLSLPELLETVRRRNPALRASGASAAAAATRVAEASTLPDPVLQLGLMNFGLPDLNADMPASMAPSVQLTQRVPFPGKLGLMGEIASQGHRMAEAVSEVAWWQVRERAADLFYDLYALDRRIEVMRETLALLEEFQVVAKSMYASGTGRQADVLRADVEVARMDGEIRTMEANRRVVAARLNALVDAPAGSPVASPALPPLPSGVPGPDTLAAWALESSATLLHARLGVRQAATRADLARREIWPDVTLGVTYGQRDMGMGTERMGSVMLGFALPVHAGKRQLAMRDEATALRMMAEAELGGAEAMVDARIGELLAELERARSLVALYRDEVLPEARATVESAFTSYRVGSVDFMTLVDAQMTVNRYEGELHQLLSDYGSALAGLESAVGRALPDPDQTMATKPGEGRGHITEER